LADHRGTSRRILAVCLGITGALGASYGLALLVTAASGSRSPSGILLGGFGFILLVLSLLLIGLAVKQWKPQEPGPYN
jgi:hypothetical protein